jgi:hypothetical protein
MPVCTSCVDCIHCFLQILPYHSTIHSTEIEGCPQSCVGSIAETGDRDVYPLAATFLLIHGKNRADFHAEYVCSIQVPVSLRLQCTFSNTYL